MRTLASRFYEERSWPYQLARYLTIGGLVFVVDIGAFTLFLRLHWWLPAGTATAYALGVIAHFTLNKYVNFRAHDRSVHSQAVTYGAVVGFCLLTTLAIVSGAVALGLPPLAGKLLAVAANVPIGFLGHRHLTFGRGILASLRAFAGRRAR
ncbi:MAG TPA: GtrA family protein [Verrucomicrobiae bacterium]|nr:GtrA family protein [Verrucomicrobiae bacterium]